MLRKRNTPRICFGIGLVGLTTLLTSCTQLSMPQSLDNHTPNYEEESKGYIPGAVTGGIFRALQGGQLSRVNVNWAELLGGFIGGEIKAHPEVMVTELQNKGINAFIIGETLVVALHTDEFFYPGSTEIRPDAETHLHTISNLMVRYSHQPIQVAGFSDDPGDIFYNIDQAEARASAIAAYMWANGVNPERVHIINHGDENSTVAELATASGLADNRHVILCTMMDPPSFALDLPLRL